MEARANEEVNLASETEADAESFCSVDESSTIAGDMSPTDDHDTELPSGSTEDNLNDYNCDTGPDEPESTLSNTSDDHARRDTSTDVEEAEEHSVKEDIFTFPSLSASNGPPRATCISAFTHFHPNGDAIVVGTTPSRFAPCFGRL